MKGFMLSILCALLPITCFSADSIYCPENHGFIKIGMTADEVLAACGQPNSRHETRGQATKRVAVKQLIYAELNKGSSVYPGLNAAFYTQWSLPSGSRGTDLEIDIIDNKVNAIRINGSSSNAMTLCHNGNVNTGDDVNSVYSACGTPTSVNNTYVNEPIPSNARPQIWVYQVDAYHPIINLTFVNGRLESID